MREETWFPHKQACLKETLTVVSGCGAKAVWFVKGRENLEPARSKLREWKIGDKIQLSIQVDGQLEHKIAHALETAMKQVILFFPSSLGSRKKT